MKLWMPVISTGTGAETYARDLAQGLRELGHEVELQTAPHHCQYAPWMSGLKPAQAPDVTLANSWSAAAFAQAAPLVTVVHHVVHDPAMTGHKSLPQRLFHAGFVRPMERAALRRSRRVIAVSRTTARQVADFLAPVTVDVVLNGVDTAFFCPSPRDHDQPAVRPLRLLYVGKYSRRKGFDMIAGIMGRLGDRAELTMIGGGLEAGLDLPRGKDLGRVERDALRQAYRDADFLIFPSRQEGFGLVAAEAMACGLPVLCVGGGAVEEVVQPPMGGISAPAGRVGDLADMAARLFDQPDRYAAMRRSARQRAVRDLDRDRWIRETEALLQAAADEVRP